MKTYVTVLAVVVVLAWLTGWRWLSVLAVTMWFGLFVMVPA
ncbi:hypothetical protein [Chromobacterium sp. IIBBL 290-4]|nr:hypothetical protein [Chromobacterium sp. IIBBL 290-4]